MRYLALDSNILYPGLWSARIQELKPLVNRRAVVLLLPNIVMPLKQCCKLTKFVTGVMGNQREINHAG